MDHGCDISERLPIERTSLLTFERRQIRWYDSREAASSWLSLLVVALLLSQCCVVVGSPQGANDERIRVLRQGMLADSNVQEADNWAVLVCTSRWWYNYRHIANTISMYHILRENGFPDDRIILMLADDIACDARNPFPGQIFNSGAHDTNLYGEDVSVDYRGEDVTVDNFVRLMTGRTFMGTPPTKQLGSTANSNVFLYMTGHGGVDFLKFQDTEELSGQDLSWTIRQMFLAGRYKSLFFMVDTCHAESLLFHIGAPHVIGLASSAVDENSYSYSERGAIGVPLMDRFTLAVLHWTQSAPIGSASLQDLIRHLQSQKRSISSTPSHYATDKRLYRMRVREFWQCHGSCGDAAFSQRALQIDAPPGPGSVACSNALNADSFHVCQALNQAVEQLQRVELELSGGGSRMDQSTIHRLGVEEQGFRTDNYSISLQGILLVTGLVMVGLMFVYSCLFERYQPPILQAATVSRKSM
jgi:GPI-anchor transamidase subunit K